MSIIEKDQPMIIALTEIKPKRTYDFNISEYNIPCYTLFVNNKIKRGVAIYAHVSLNAQLFNTLNDSGFEESVWCQFSTLNNTKVLLGCIYKSPNTTKQNVINLFSLLELANKSISNNDKICIMGDFNYPSIKWNGILTHDRDFEFVEAIRDAYLYQVVTKPTRSRLGQTANITDLVLVNDESFITEIDHCCPLGKSDHQLLKFSIQLDCLFDRSICPKTVFDFSKADFYGLRDHFSNYNDWTLLINLDINEGWNLIKNRICDGMIKFIPTVTLKNNKEFKPKWINNKVKRCLQKKYTYYLKYLFYLIHNCTTDGVTCGKHYEEYVKYRNIANSEKRKSRKHYENNIAEKCKTDPKKFWKYVNTLMKVKNGISKLDLGNGITAETDKQKSQALNLFFSSVFHNETLDNFPAQNCANNSDGVCLPEVVITPQAVFNKLKTLNPTKSEGPDRIAPRVLLELQKFLYIPLTILFNNSIEKGSIPCDWKNAEITPIF